MTVSTFGVTKSSFQQQKAWADGHLPEIKRVIREVAGEVIDIRIANDNEDTKQATDYVVTVSSGAIACRVRDWKAWERHGDFTLRCWVISGRTTELEKIRNGHGRWYLYAWARPDKKFGAWIFVDLDTVRSSGSLDMKWPVIPNVDGKSKFIGISRAALKTKGCIIRAGGDAA